MFFLLFKLTIQILYSFFIFILKFRLLNFIVFDEAIIVFELLGPSRGNGPDEFSDSEDYLHALIIILLSPAQPLPDPLALVLPNGPDPSPNLVHNALDLRVTPIAHMQQPLLEFLEPGLALLVDQF